MAKNNPKHDRGRFIQFDIDLLESPAYRDLKVAERSLLTELLMIYNGSNNGRIGLSVRHAVDRLRIADRTVTNSFRALLSHGFIRCKSDADWVNGMAREWTLTFRKLNGNQPTDDWRFWPFEKSATEKTTSPEVRRSVPHLTTVPPADLRQSGA